MSPVTEAACTAPPEHGGSLPPVWRNYADALVLLAASGGVMHGGTASRTGIKDVEQYARPDQRRSMWCWSATPNTQQRSTPIPSPLHNSQSGSCL